MAKVLYSVKPRSIIYFRNKKNEKNARNFHMKLTEVGLLVGSSLGTPLGIRDGGTLGIPVGNSEGTPLGSKLGSLLGCWLGLEDGCTDGFEVGNIEGC